MSDPTIDHLIDGLTRAACDNLPLGTSSANLAAGHRFSYEQCAGPDCSCWQPRRAMILAACESIELPQLIERMDAFFHGKGDPE